MVSGLRGFVLAMLLGAMCAISGGQTGVKIPEVKGTSFTDEAVNLPEMLRGKVGVLVVGFSQGSRDAVTGWGKRLAADYRESPTVVYYEMPVLAGVPRMIRGYVVGKIKASVSDRAKPRFVPVMNHEAEWRATANYKSGDDAYVLVVDEGGVVRWQTRGSVTDAAYGAVKEQVETLRAGIGHAVR
jgi:ATP10 protein